MARDGSTLVRHPYGRYAWVLQPRGRGPDGAHTLHLAGTEELGPHFRPELAAAIVRDAPYAASRQGRDVQACFVDARRGRQCVRFVPRGAPDQRGFADIVDPRGPSLRALLGLTARP